MVKKTVVIGTRASKLALWQAHHIADALRSEYPDLNVEIRHMVTTGDKILDVPLAKIGGKGLFTKELEQAMLAGEIDLAVHSLKDMPTQLPEGLILGAITERADAADALVSVKYNSLAELPSGAKVGTSSLRRKAQLLHHRPDLTILDLRGNLDTRLRKLDEGQFDAILLAAAGLKRLGWQERIREELPPEICLPAVGQGALAIECRADDSESRERIAFLDHLPTHQGAAAERAYLHRVEGGCQVPLGVYATVTKNELRLEAAVYSLDGKRGLRRSVCGPADKGNELGLQLADAMLDDGAREILQEIMEGQA
ncbi:hydroxymethylbilane synthase [Azotosporobacter soli]|uniref:hydroxymethylbilane synthase n=1 Tax=Azotosporobacter soli TaxID=3055040 RepID=UPI0031FF1765